jgi:hypothetical protein
MKNPVSSDSGKLPLTHRLVLACRASLTLRSSSTLNSPCCMLLKTN